MFLIIITLFLIIWYNIAEAQTHVFSISSLGFLQLSTEVFLGETGGFHESVQSDVFSLHGDLAHHRCSPWQNSWLWLQYERAPCHPIEPWHLSYGVGCPYWNLQVSIAIAKGPRDGPEYDTFRLPLIGPLQTWEWFPDVSSRSHWMMMGCGAVGPKMAQALSQDKGVGHPFVCCVTALLCSRTIKPLCDVYRPTRRLLRTVGRRSRRSLKEIWWFSNDSWFREKISA